MSQRKDPFRTADNWTECPVCQEAFGWNKEDGLIGQTCACGHEFTGRERRYRMNNKYTTKVIAAAKEVISRWENGDLAGAVNGLQGAIQKYEKEEKEQTPATEAAMVRVSLKDLLNVISYLADEERHYKQEPTKNHIWLTVKRLLDATTRPDATVCPQQYLAFIWGDIEPTVIGPFRTARERIKRAIKLRLKKGEGHGIYMLDIQGGKPTMSAYGGDFFKKKEKAPSPARPKKP